MKQSLLFHADAWHIPLRDESVSMVWTSPPWWRARDYGLGANQIGLEPDVDMYVGRLVDVLRECRRVLKKTGTAWLHLGDTYAASGGGHHARDPERWPKQAAGAHLPTKARVNNGAAKPKDLLGLPWRVALGLRADGWYLRADIVVARTNPTPEAVSDRPIRAHEHLFMLAKGDRYHYKSRYLPRSARFDVWHVSSDRSRIGHFAVAPRQLVRWSVIAGSRPGDIALDPFAGSGTTLAIAAKLDRYAIGLERNGEFVRLARHRMYAAAR
jgi:site-specific DNA-methyltransferase (cytosine-N4-specific)